MQHHYPIYEADLIWKAAKSLDADSHVGAEPVEKRFEELALRLFKYQAAHVPAYREFIRHLGINPNSVDAMSSIPFMPVEFFKSHKIHDSISEPILRFESSRTTSSAPSIHYVANPQIYEDSFVESFKLFYGDPSDFRILALLPGYLERGNSSLVYMVDRLISKAVPDSGFYLDRLDDLAQELALMQELKRPCLLIGVTFALLDLFEKHPMKLPDLLIMETGGMKGVRKELVRSELHQVLKLASGVSNIHSEYGMTELLSQAYSCSEGVFKSPPWMKVFLRSIHDPLGDFVNEGSGLANIVDLANVHSCSFLSTKDLARINKDGGFEILGRMDESDIRGCNLMVV
ncbi:MAG: acyl transferase [Bacteroidota bacterium]